MEAFPETKRVARISFDWLSLICASTKINISFVQVNADKGKEKKRANNAG